jgi:hypothetical protein
MRQVQQARVIVLAGVIALACHVNAFGQGVTQASITGIVRDTSGAVLPGVTVEAASPVLIEKSRNAVSDDTGRYRIIALNPGTYTVTFTLPGFNSVKREAIELTGSLTATIDVEMRVGSLEETVTVIGESPIVDVESIRQQRVIDDEAIHAIPGQRSYHSLVVLVPGLSVGNIQNRPVERGRPRWRQLGRPLQRGRPGRERIERRWHALRDRHAERLGSVDRYHRRPGRGRSRRAGDQRRAAHWRQHVQRLGLL